MVASTGFSVKQWRRYGHHRLYVDDPQGQTLGWFDLKSRQAHADTAAERTIVAAAATRWMADNGIRPADATVPRQRSKSAATQTPRRFPEKPATPRKTLTATPSGTDLAGNRPGEALMAIARKHQLENRFLRVLARTLRIRTPDTSWRVGAAGERIVGRRLNKLERHGWRILHNVDLPGGGDVDHLLIGPGGIWTVNTKHLRLAWVTAADDALYVRGRRKEYPEAARREATRVAEVLRRTLDRTVSVSPMIVVHGHSRLHGWWRRRPMGVVVLPSWAVRLRLRWHRRVLSPVDVDEIYSHARWSGTWRKP
ncbi:nuclease-related domain-containing protein [Stackebrandtia soli]|uniref:nuclease-related domain-containing protein n=1 Tax=Stackebrandtia soli TaxID=1892856 RepID=UPI0039ED2722